MLDSKNITSFFNNIAGAVDFAIGVPMETISKTFSAQKIAKYAFESGIKSSYSDNFEQAFSEINAIHNGDKNKKRAFIRKILGYKNKTPARIIVCGSLYLVGEFLKENR